MRVVYTTKICPMTTCTKLMNIYYSEVTLLLQCVSFCFQSHTYLRCFLHFCIQNTPKCHKPKNMKKKVVLKTTIYTSSLREPNFIPKKCNLPSVGHVQRFQCSTSIYIRKVALQSANNWVQWTGRITFPRRIVYFLNELRQPVVETACRHICNGRFQSLHSFFKVFRGKKTTGFQSTGLH